MEEKINLEEELQNQEEIDKKFEDLIAALQENPDVPEFKANRTIEKIQQVELNVGFKYKDVKTFDEFITAQQELGDALKHDYLDGYRHGYSKLDEIPKELRELSAPYSYVYSLIYSRLHQNMQNALYSAQNKEANEEKGLDAESNLNIIHNANEEPKESEKIAKDIRDLERIIKLNYKSNSRTGKNKYGQTVTINYSDSIIGYTTLFNAKEYGEMIKGFAKKYNVSLDPVVTQCIDAYKKGINKKREQQAHAFELSDEEIQQNRQKGAQTQPIKGLGQRLNSKIYSDSITADEAAAKLVGGYELHKEYESVMEYYNSQKESENGYAEKVTAYRERVQETNDQMLKLSYEECAKVYENYSLFSKLDTYAKMDRVHSHRGFWNRLFNWRKYGREKRAMATLKSEIEANPRYQEMKQANPEITFEEALTISKNKLPDNYATIKRRIKAQDAQENEQAARNKKLFSDNAIVEEIDESQFKYGDQELDEEYQNELSQENKKNSEASLKEEEAKDNLDRGVAEIKEFSEEEAAKLKEAREAFLKEHPEEAQRKEQELKEALEDAPVEIK